VVLNLFSVAKNSWLIDPAHSILQLRICGKGKVSSSGKDS